MPVTVIRKGNEPLAGGGVFQERAAVALVIAEAAVGHVPGAQGVAETTAEGGLSSPPASTADT